MLGISRGGGEELGEVRRIKSGNFENKMICPFLDKLFLSCVRVSSFFVSWKWILIQERIIL